MTAIDSVDELDGDAQPVGQSLDTAFHQAADVERPGDAVDRYVGVPVELDAVARDDPQRAHLGELVDQRLGEPVGEVAQLAVLAEVVEVEDGDRRGRQTRLRLGRYIGYQTRSITQQQPAGRDDAPGGERDHAAGDGVPPGQQPSQARGQRAVAGTGRARFPNHRCRRLARRLAALRALYERRQHYDRQADD